MLVAVSIVGALALIGVIILHLIVYFTVTRVNSNRPPEALNDPSIWLDNQIPLIPWTWIFYWAAYPYLTLGAGILIAMMPRRAIYVTGKDWDALAEP